MQAAVDGIKQKAYAAAGLDEAAAARRWRTSTGAERRLARHAARHQGAATAPTRARPLYGIWAAAPYLHNGSVPTLHDLLLPPEHRPKTFALGAREYDPVKLGFVVETSASQQDCLVDTTRGPATAMAATSGAPTCPSPTAWRCWSISRRTDRGAASAALAQPARERAGKGERARAPERDFRRMRRRAPEGDCRERRSERLADQPSGGLQAGRAAAPLARRAADNHPVVGRLGEAEAEPADRKPPGERGRIGMAGANRQARSG